MQPAAIPPQTRLLKANDVRALGSKVVFNFEDLRQQADAYIADVQKQARTIINTAQSQAQSIRRLAQEHGFDHGRREGFHQADESIAKQARELADKAAFDALATTLPAMNEAIEQLRLERDRWLAQWESTAVQLAAAIAERLLRRRIEADPVSVQDMIRGALELAVGTPHVKLRLHPDDVRLLGAHADEVVRAMASSAHAEITPDPAITRGGCLVETAHGTIDGRIETLLDRIVSELLQKDG